MLCVGMKFTQIVNILSNEGYHTIDLRKYTMSRYWIWKFTYLWILLYRLRTWNRRRFFIDTFVRSSLLILALWKKSKPAIPAPRESFDSSIYLSFEQSVQWMSQVMQVLTRSVICLLLLAQIMLSKKKKIAGKCIVQEFIVELYAQRPNMFSCFIKIPLLYCSSNLSMHVLLICLK